MSEYRSISTVEKRQFMEEDGEPWPVCACHGIKKTWNARHVPAGGHWTNTCSRRAGDRRRAQTPGTYRYNWNHGEGETGEAMRDTYFARRRTPGNHSYENNLAGIDERMQKYIPGTVEYQEYYERKLKHGN